MTDIVPTAAKDRHLIAELPMWDLLGNALLLIISIVLVVPVALGGRSADQA